MSDAPISPEAIARVDVALAAGAAAVATMHAGAIKAAAAFEERAARDAVLEKPADDFPCCSPGSTAHLETKPFELARYCGAPAVPQRAGLTECFRPAGHDGAHAANGFTWGASS